MLLLKALGPVVQSPIKLILDEWNQLYSINMSEFYEWLFGPEMFSQHA